MATRVRGNSLAVVSIALLAACQAAVAGAKPVTAAAAGKFAQIDRERLLTTDAHPEDWLTTGRDWGKTHHSPLAQIDTKTVASLGFAWQFDTHTNRGLEATPIEVGGVLFTSGVAGRVYALNAVSGKLLWSFTPSVDMEVTRKSCCDQVNRGVAVWDGKVYVAALDGMLYALNAATGAVQWSVDTIDDKKRGYTSTGAPEIAGGVVVIGNGGAEFDARGYISAYDLGTGRLAWRFFTAPGDPSKPYENPDLKLAAATWDPKSRWDVGGGGTVWDGMVYDPVLNLLYVGTGNGALYDRAKRSPSGGDNLFLCSILALNPDTGRLVWYYQETPGDQWDFDAVQPMVLTDLMLNGAKRQVLLQASKNGFFYVLDRNTGKLLSAEKYAPTTWATHVDPKTGRAVEDRASADYSDGKPKLIFPSFMGAHNWPPMAYSPATGLVYIPVREAGSLMFDTNSKHIYRPGQDNTGVDILLAPILEHPESLPEEVQRSIVSDDIRKNKPDIHTRSLLRAWDPVRQKTVWERELELWVSHSGVLSTSGGLVFQGTFTGHFVAYDARSGATLKDIDVGTSIMAAPMTYSVGGVQYIAVMAALGGGGWNAPDPATAAYRYGNQGRIIAFKLGGGAVPRPEPLPPLAPIPQPPVQSASAASEKRGEALFSSNCANCHSNVPRSAAPDLRRMTAATHRVFSDILLKGLLKPLGMPQWDDLLSAKDVADIHAYLIAESWRAYKKQSRNGGGEQAAPISVY